jgi:hypothetical protein
MWDCIFLDEHSRDYLVVGRIYSGRSVSFLAGVKRKMNLLLPCSYKRIFFTESSAIGFRNKQRNEFDRELRVYKCNFCLWWHLTSKPLKEKKSRR